MTRYMQLVQGSDGQMQLEDYEESYAPALAGPGLPRWAVVAGRVMFALRHPRMKGAGWLAFARVDRAAKSGNPFSRQIREGIRRIAQALLSHRIRGEDDTPRRREPDPEPSYPSDSDLFNVQVQPIAMPEPEGGGSIRA